MTIFISNDMLNYVVCDTDHQYHHNVIALLLYAKFPDLFVLTTSYNFEINCNWCKATHSWFV